MLNIVVLVSGGGTNLQALIDASEQGRIPGGAITCVISSRPDAYALKRAKTTASPPGSFAGKSMRTCMRTVRPW